MRQRVLPTESLVTRYQVMPPTGSLTIEGVAPVKDKVSIQRRAEMLLRQRCYTVSNPLPNVLPDGA